MKTKVRLVKVNGTFSLEFSIKCRVDKMKWHHFCCKYLRLFVSRIPLYWNVSVTPPPPVKVGVKFNDTCCRRMTSGQPGNPYSEVKLSTVDLLVLSSLDQLLFQLKILFIFVKNQATVMWRSSVLSLPLQIVFPGPTFHSLIGSTSFGQKNLAQRHLINRHLADLVLGRECLDPVNND